MSGGLLQSDSSIGLFSDFLWKIKWRRRRDSNSRSIAAQTLSKRPPSTTRPRLRKNAKPIIHATHRLWKGKRSSQIRRKGSWTVNGCEQRRNQKNRPSNPEVSMNSERWSLFQSSTTGRGPEKGVISRILSIVAASILGRPYGIIVLTSRR